MGVGSGSATGWLCGFKRPNLFKPQVPTVRSGDNPNYLTRRRANDLAGVESLHAPPSLWPGPRCVSCQPRLKLPHAWADGPELGRQVWAGVREMKE